MLSALPAIWTPNDIRISPTTRLATTDSSLSVDSDTHHPRRESTTLTTPSRKYSKDIQTAHPVTQPVLASGHGIRPSFITFVLSVNLLLVCCSLVPAVFLHAKHKSGRKAFSFLLGFFSSCVATCCRTGELGKGGKAFPTSLNT